MEVTELVGDGTVRMTGADAMLKLISSKYNPLLAGEHSLPTQTRMFTPTHIHCTHAHTNFHSLSLSLSTFILSLSLTHTHTHTHTKARFYTHRNRSTGADVVFHRQEVGDG